MPSHRDKNDRSRSPTSRPKKRRSRSPIAPKRPLPLGAKELHKDDLRSYRNMFALYLDIQKQIDIESLDDREIKGRWKSFVKKWNQGDLAEGWYDTETKLKADARAAEATTTLKDDNDGGSDSEEIGPSVPRKVGESQFGPAIPNTQDLEYRREVLADDALAAREASQYEYKTERKLANDRLAELVPRADAGTHERRLEKKHDIAAVHSSFRDVKEGGAEEVADTDLLGDGGLDEYKKRRKEEEMRKSDRQLRREEHERARAEERKERGKVLREKEDQTMALLKGLAQQRFG